MDVNLIANSITISNKSNLKEVNPAIAYNSVHQEYLAVWYKDQPGNDDIDA